MFKSLLMSALFAFSIAAHAEQDDYYIVSMEDIHVLDTLERPQDGMEYARCRDNSCYIMTTGELIGEGRDGIYMVWATAENAE